jgi:hypothetical protein
LEIPVLDASAVKSVQQTAEGVQPYHVILDLELETWNLELETWNLELGT